jgi:tetraacyldisaccharide 4'-kinase
MRILLLPFSLLYQFIISLRNLMYDLNIIKSRFVNIPVISVGNISVGGTGKTPTVEFLVEYFTANKKKVAVLSRGYKRSTKGSLLVSNGKEILVSANESGDESYQIARKYSGCVVAVDEDRSRMADNLSKNFNLDVIILDDAFQHRKLSRNYNIVLINSKSNPFNDFLLPAGNLREPLKSLKRANAIILTNCSGEKKYDELEEDLKKYSYAEIFKTKVTACIIYDLNNHEFDIEFLKEKNIITFSGIANSNNFLNLISNSGGQVKKSFDYTDHHYFKLNEIQSLGSFFLKNKSDIILTTEKDISRLISDTIIMEELKKYPVYYLSIKIDFLNDKEMFLSNMEKGINWRKVN